MEFQSTVIKGFTGREVVTGIVAFLSAGGISVLVLNFTDLPINVCVYFGIPVMFLVAFCGMWKIQGMTLGVWIREILYVQKTKRLSVEAGEYEEEMRVFTMRRRGGKNRWQFLMEIGYFHRKKN